MSITGGDWTARGRTCFYCGRPMDDPAVHWMGAAGPDIPPDDLPPEIQAMVSKVGPVGPALHIYLHLPCVDKLTARLLRDRHEIENPDYYERRRKA